jgi:hypothetical protein
MRPATLTLVALLVAALLAGCGVKKETLGDTTAVSGPGVRALAPPPPPWMPEYAHLAQRIKQLGLPPVGKEQYHTHALLHIYDDGILIPIAPNIGIDRAKKAYSSVHTHDSTGIVHMESKVPHKFTLGAFFAIWGVRFGDASLGSLVNKGAKQVRVYVNGKPVSHPVNYVMRDKDNIVVGYGTDSSFPHNPSTKPLQLVSGKGGGTCAQTPKGKKRKSCIAGG